MMLMKKESLNYGRDGGNTYTMFGSMVRKSQEGVRTKNRPRLTCTLPSQNGQSIESASMLVKDGVERGQRAMKQSC